MVHHCRVPYSSYTFQVEWFSILNRLKRLRIEGENQDWKSALQILKFSDSLCSCFRFAKLATSEDARLIDYDSILYWETFSTGFMNFHWVNCEKPKFCRNWSEERNSGKKVGKRACNLTVNCRKWSIWTWNLIPYVLGTFWNWFHDFWSFKTQVMIFFSKLSKAVISKREKGNELVVWLF